MPIRSSGGGLQIKTGREAEGGEEPVRQHPDDDRRRIGAWEFPDDLHVSAGYRVDRLDFPY